MDTILNQMTEFAVKAAVGVISALFVDSIFTVFVLFILLEILDIVTRCIAESAKLYNEQHATNGNIYKYIKYMGIAHKRRYINSEKLRQGFCSKMITYCIVLLLVSCVDGVLVNIAVPKFFAKATLSVFVISEALSILENIEDCGVTQVTKVINKIKLADKEGEKK